MVGVSSAPVPSSAGVSDRMRRQARKHTKPELALRQTLHARGLRYRVGLRVPGLARRTMDIAFTRARVAVFVDGCFWHGCPVHATWPTANADWWAAKINKNRERDGLTTAHLLELGWAVVRVWEHEAPAEAANRIEAIVLGRRVRQRSVSGRP
jgi:DNA mismatch endonuclease, patch repair protein